ncbi:hypothetical protein TNCV_798941 [Trichonephila clavipes]|nr:hypothetical protein TNCV_798941 [Trichonephila clavipes]
MWKVVFNLVSIDTPTLSLRLCQLDKCCIALQTVSKSLFHLEEMKKNQAPPQWLLPHCKKLSNRLDFSSGFLRNGLAICCKFHCQIDNNRLYCHPYKPQRRQLVYLQFSLELVALDRQKGLFIYSRVLVILDGKRPQQVRPLGQDIVTVDEVPQHQR